MVQKKGKYRVCLYCSHEVRLYNNDEQFSWDLHKQEPFHIRRRLKGKKKINSKDLSNMYIQSMKDLFQSESNIDSWAEELIRLADEQLAKQERNVEVEKAVARLFSAIYNGNFQIILFGSRITGLTISEAGDLDIFVDTSENEDMSLVDNPELENHYLQRLENFMKTNEYNTWVNVSSVLSCRTPIVKGLHYDTKMQCDITVMNGFGIVNTHLMALFLNNIPKLRCLILLIREWSLASGFTKERDINNYALSMLVLFYLQQEKYAPSVDELKFDYSGPTKIISGYECINYEQVKCNWKSYKDTLLARLGTLRGEEIAITHDGTTYNIKLPSLNKPADLPTAFSALTSAIGCCPQIFSLEPRPTATGSADCCSRCEPQHCPPPSPRSPPAKRKPPAELEAATSTTPADPAPLQESPVGTQIAKTPTNEWTIEDVIQFIEATDPGLAVHADLFRKHEIDGKALLLLNSDMMMKYMGLKLGPALKICNLVTRLKGRRHMLH